MDFFFICESLECPSYMRFRESLFFGVFSNLFVRVQGWWCGLCWRLQSQTEHLGNLVFVQVGFLGFHVIRTNFIFEAMFNTSDNQMPNNKRNISNRCSINMEQSWTKLHYLVVSTSPHLLLSPTTEQQSNHSFRAACCRLAELWPWALSSACWQVWSRLGAALILS